MNEFVRLMEKVENPGTFSVSGALSSILPGLKVKGLGTIALPFLAQQAEALIQLAEQAPFGRGEATIVDTSVRNVWQISAENFELTNPQWQKSLQESINQMGKQLGLHDCKIICDPYKLLIYGKGSFFTTHRDTEKIPNMFATLVVNLPSEHEGGELIVSHAGQSQSYSFADSDSFQPRFVAFYADCYHEVKPITAGYRICLIYNLAIANRNQQPLLAQQFQVVEDVGNAIQAWSRENHENPFLTYLLEHDYSEKNLTLANLKNGDFPKASVLLNAAEKNDCQAFLCLVTYYRTSYGEAAYYGRYANEDDLDEDDFEEYDVDGEEVYAHAFVTATGTKVNIQKLELAEEELLAKTPLREGTGYGFSISEATGNEGATKELWYHRGAVILWPKANEFDLIPKMDLAYGIHFLKESLHGKNPLTGDQRQQIIRLAQHIIEKQPTHNGEDIANELMLIGDIGLLQSYLHKEMKHYNLSRVNGPKVIEIAERFGWQHFEEIVGSYLTPQRGALQWLTSLLLVKEPFPSESQSVLKRWVSTLWQPSLAFRLTSEEIASLIRLVVLFNIETVPDAIIAFLALQTQDKFLTTIYGPAVISTLNALQGHEYNRTIVQKFVDDVRQRIQTDFPNPPEQPTDWSREGQLGCTCEFCTEVNKMLPDPKRREIGFYKTLKRNMVHVESEIAKAQVDLDITIRSRPPKFEGFCSKNQKRYDNKRKVFDDAQKIVKDLQLENGR